MAVAEKVPADDAIKEARVQRLGNRIACIVRLRDIVRHGDTSVSSLRLEREDAGEVYSRSGVRGSDERQEHTQRELNRLSQ